jgi:SAM-dependent methyltransferase
MSDAWDAFLTLHRDLPREGPGEAADVVWAAAIAGTPSDARILDAACGPGGDIAALLDVAPRGHVTACDRIAHFMAAARETHAEDPRVTLLEADMTALQDPFDLIWCAGAVYFIGVTEALTAWRPALAPGGAIAFSEACWFSDTPSEAARRNFADYPAMTNETGIRARIAAAGCSVLATWRLSDAAWENYLGPLDDRVARLRPQANDALSTVLDAQEAEAALWRAERDSFGYLLCVVRPE